MGVHHNPYVAADILMKELSVENEWDKETSKKCKKELCSFIFMQEEHLADYFETKWHKEQQEKFKLLICLHEGTKVRCNYKFSWSIWHPPNQDFMEKIMQSIWEDYLKTDKSLAKIGESLNSIRVPSCLISNIQSLICSDQFIQWKLEQKCGNILWKESLCWLQQY
jgi:hypothetical protein